MRSLRFLLMAAALAYTARADALYDPPTDATVSRLQGEWRGTLTYDDYSHPGQRVTLPTTLYIAASSPHEVVLHYVFDDGPGKTVYSYERLAIDAAAKTVRTSAGVGERKEEKATLVSESETAGVRTIVFETTGEKGRDRQTLDIGADTLVWRKEEIVGQQAPRFRNRYEFRRAGARPAGAATR
jgi:hypothetical protein